MSTFRKRELTSTGGFLPWAIPWGLFFRLQQPKLRTRVSLTALHNISDLCMFTIYPLFVSC